MSIRWLLSLLLATWTLLSIARLVFDLIGNLWVVVVFDFVQIVFLISGLFGATQKRRPLLYTLLTSNALSVIVNVLIFLWYIGVFGEISRPYLSAGLPYSSSFFLRFTPGCDAEFDVIRKKWVQKTCLIPFYSIEASQSILHIIFAIVTSIFSILVLIEIKKKPIRSCSQSINHYAQISASKVAKAPSTGTTNNSSSGYLNSQYDDLSSSREKSSAEVKKEVKGQFERNSKKKKKTPRPAMPAPDCAPCSSNRSSEEENNPEDVYTKPIKKKSLVLRRPDLEEDVNSPHITPTNVTSLVSFDPKSATLLRIRQHLEAEPSDRDTPDYDMYERLRSRSSGGGQSDIVPASTIPLSSDYKSRNASQDSVPSMFAPMLDSPAPSSTSSRSSGASSGLRPFGKAGISLSVDPSPILSPGIRLSEQLGAKKQPYKSAFRVQKTENARVISHYHAPNEIPLSSDPSVVETGNYPVMTSGGLLV
ncbi:hypothetical protein GCK72_004954 [Caenorhabditis remanei]|uniref:Sodium/potassium-transporting ATPase subunit beta-1-interacting protein n=1 Tax=Caenorhabditis remanei TaxID=31234 RepID=A0A6A5HF68_CAERE|nr:hypothetical protein GCK72_004954 [Caenorhabditis remanei]KAF1765003.1 hypothetical protein GCK72_004954 [Caenorhabditis remanei]